MRRRAAILGLSLFLAACGAEPPADLVLTGGRIHVTVGGPVVDAIALRDGRVLAVGGEYDLERWIGPDTRVEPLRGATVLPGLADNHLHSIGGGPGVDLSRARSLGDIHAALAERAAGTPAGEPIVTNSDWHEGQLAEQRLPLRDELDRAVPDHPLVVVRGGHEYILNSAALARFGIRASDPDPPGGRIGRYPDGRLNGELVDRAKEPVRLPPSAPADPVASWEDALSELNRLGLVAIRVPGGSRAEYDAFATLRDQGRLTARVEYLFRWPRGAGAEDVDSVLAGWPAPDSGDDWLRVGGVKLGVDGGFEGGWMREPYEEPWGEGGTYHGLQTMARDDFIAVVRALNARGWRVATHAVGDAAIDLVLDAYEAAHAETPITDRRWVIEHGFMPRPEHFERMRALGLHVTAQDHLYLAAPSLVSYWGRERAEWTTPLKAYLDAGIPVSTGTDSPVVPYPPFWTLYHFTTRGTISGGVMGADQRLPAAEVWRAATEGYAALTFREGVSGTLQPGRFADLLVLEEDPFEIDPERLEDLEPVLTVVGGRVVWPPSS
ncbi:MAG: amidohydrolase [Gemmatimonadota bacterium]|nr:amidohydrolase [Gemmatimonadota bacterium]